jgi:HSP20 family protein
MALSSILGRRNNFWDAPDPFDVVVSVFDNTPAGSFARDSHAVASTNVDWKETPTEHVFKADLPGLKKEEVQVQLEEGRTLSISGQRKKEEVQKTDTWHRVERSSGQFMRKFRLPENANLDHITANVENGVLTVVVPKEEKKVIKARSIAIGGHDGQHMAIEKNPSQGAAE